MNNTNNKPTNETLYSSLLKYTKLRNNEAEKMDMSVSSDSYVKEFSDISTTSSSADINKSAWDKAFSKYGSQLGLKDFKAYCYLMGQILHESANFKYMKEIGSGKGKSYGVPSGPYSQLYYGRGPIQVTWESNYKLIYDSFFVKNGLSNINIYKNPDLANNPYVGSLLSIGWLICTNNGKLAINACNDYNVVKACKYINGGKNGLSSRIEKTNSLLRKYNL